MALLSSFVSPKLNPVFVPINLHLCISSFPIEHIGKSFPLYSRCRRKYPSLIFHIKDTRLKTPLLLQVIARDTTFLSLQLISSFFVQLANLTPMLDDPIFT